MAIQVVKEGNRMPGYSVNPANTTVLAGNIVNMDATDASGNTVNLFGAAGLEALGILLDGTMRSLATNAIPGRQGVTEYNRGGLCAVSLGSGAVYRIYNDGLGQPLVVAPVAGWHVNLPIYAKQGVAIVDGTAQITADAAGAVRIGRIIKVAGSTVDDLEVTYVSEV